MRPWHQTYFKMYGDCQESYRLSCIEKVKQEESEKAKFGTMGHLYNECAVADDFKPFRDKYIEITSEVYDDLAACWQRIYKAVFRGIWKDSIREKQFSIDFDGKPCDHEGAFMTGTPDLVSASGLAMLDYKYGTSSWWFKLQSTWYFCIVPHLPKHGLFLFWILHPRVVDEAGNFQVNRVEYQARDRERWFQYLKDKIIAVEADISMKIKPTDWTVAKKKSQCKRCFVKKHCKRKKEVK